jgi:hypothetical protein
MLAANEERINVHEKAVKFISAISPVIVPDLPAHYAVERTARSNVRAGQDVLLIITSTCA